MQTIITIVLVICILFLSGSFELHDVTTFDQGKLTIRTELKCAPQQIQCFTALFPMGMSCIAPCRFGIRPCMNQDPGNHVPLNSQLFHPRGYRAAQVIKSPFTARKVVEAVVLLGTTALHPLGRMCLTIHWVHNRTTIERLHRCLAVSRDQSICYTCVVCW